MEKHIDIQKDVVTFQQAIDLCVLGFNEKTLCAYEIENQELYLCHLDEEGLYMPEKDIAAPLKQQVFRWFRENHGLEIILRPDCFNHESKKLREYVIISYDKSWKLEAIAEPSHFVRKGCFNTPEEAESSCIDKLIEIVKQQQQHGN